VPLRPWQPKTRQAAGMVDGQSGINQDVRPVSQLASGRSSRSRGPAQAEGVIKSECPRRGRK
jgi:hypothetical protein